MRNATLPAPLQHLIDKIQAATIELMIIIAIATIMRILTFFGLRKMGISKDVANYLAVIVFLVTFFGAYLLPTSAYLLPTK